MSTVEALSALEVLGLEAREKPRHLPMNPARKTIYTLDINDYEPAVKALTFRMMQHYAKKIGANFQIITERKFPDWPIVMEKFQCAQLARENGDDWSMFIDADAMINPECFDFIPHMPDKSYVAHNGKDFNPIRWNVDDKYFRRDGRWIGSCDWLAIASDWTRDDFWRIPDDLTPEEAFANIHITIDEHNSGMFRDNHLIDDYTLSRNIARFGLHYTTIEEIFRNLGLINPATGKGANPYLWHIYACPIETKLKRMLAVLSGPLRTQVFEEPVQIMQGNVVVGKTQDGRFIEPCGLGWSLMTAKQADVFRAMYDKFDKDGQKFDIPTWRSYIRSTAEEQAEQEKKWLA